jgi:hypothetical protein
VGGLRLLSEDGMAAGASGKSRQGVRKVPTGLRSKAWGWPRAYAEYGTQGIPTPAALRDGAVSRAGWVEGHSIVRDTFGVGEWSGVYLG